MSFLLGAQTREQYVLKAVVFDASDESGKGILPSETGEVPNTAVHIVAAITSPGRRTGWPTPHVGTCLANTLLKDVTPKHTKLNLF